MAVIIVGVILLLLAVAAWRLRGTGLRQAAVHRLRAILDRASLTRDGDFANVIFLHHSTGRNLIRQGEICERLSAAGFQFWDHDYNSEGLTRPDGTPAGYSYGIPDDNTDPDGLARLFAQRVHQLPLNAFSGLMQHEVIIFKSCFPVSHITSEAQLERYKTCYLQMRKVMDQYPDRIFIIVTPPPLNPASTDAEAAAQARAFANWLSSEDLLAGHPNVFTFDFFDYLAENDLASPDYNRLREEYRREGNDSHPNETANETIGPMFVDFVAEAIQTYRAKVGEALE